MGLISLEEVLGSAVVAAVISFVTAIVVARTTSRATIKAARFTTAEGREKEARTALGRAIIGWQIAATEDAELRVRQESAGQARAALIELSSIPGFEIKTARFHEIVGLLASPTEADLRRAAALWAAVEAEIRNVVDPREDTATVWCGLA